MITLTGLWLGKTRNGESMMSGNLGYGARIFVFKNKNKRNDKDPDYNLVVAEKTRDGGSVAPPVNDVPPPDEAPPF